MTRRFVVVSGLAASGKSTLGRVIAERIGLEFIDKDDELETLFEQRDDPAAAATPDERHRLSRAADERFIERARRSDGAVLVSFWRRDELSATAGTPIDWLDELDVAVEVHCRCPPDIALRRFVERRRHPGHGDATSITPEAARRVEQLAAFGPLGIGALIEVDTSGPFDDTMLDAVVTEVAAAR